MAREACKVCKAVEADIINRLLEVGYGPGFVSARWGLKRHHVKKHRDECLVGERRKKVEAHIERILKEEADPVQMVTDGQDGGPVKRPRRLEGRLEQAEQRLANMSPPRRKP